MGFEGFKKSSEKRSGKLAIAALGMLAAIEGQGGRDLGKKVRLSAPESSAVSLEADERIPKRIDKIVIPKSPEA